jgi:hypothetical protein
MLSKSVRRLEHQIFGLCQGVLTQVPEYINFSYYAALREEQHISDHRHDGLRGADKQGSIVHYLVSSCVCVE